MDDMIKILSHDAVLLLEQTNRERVVISLAGIPSSGKTSIAHALAQHINERQRSSVTKVVGLDGWHFSLNHLRAKMDNPLRAIEERGAAYTFDGDAFVSFVTSLQTPSSEPLPFPTFSHTLKDPIQSGDFILPSHCIVIVEGLYVNLDCEPWNKAAEVWDARWMVEAGDEEEVRERLIRRHVRTGVASNYQEALERGELSFP